MEYLYDNDDLPLCPICYNCDNVTRITQDEKNYALGLYNIYDFMGKINIMTNEYRCNKCGYEW